MSEFPVRRAIVGLTIGSFSLAALMGVIALLSGGEFGETQGKVLVTTLIVGVTSVAVLCYLATAGTPYQVVGILGGVVAVVPFTIALLMVWRGWDVGEDLNRTFTIGLVVAATLAQTSLLLGLSTSRPLPAWLLWSTVVLAAALAVVVSWVVLQQDDPGDAVLRGMGVTAILDALGTVVSVAMAVFGRRSGPGGLDVRLPEALAAQVQRAAAESGRTTDQVVADAVATHLTERSTALPR